MFLEEKRKRDDMADQKKRNVLSFDTIDNSSDLKKYLDFGSRLNSSQFLYQYTTVSALINMLRSQTMHLSNAKYMNDQLEYRNGDPQIWKNLFFSCFMMEDDESIGMWGMYAQPWREGVKISIPKEILRRWVNETSELIEISQESKQPTGRKISDKGAFRVWISTVAYSNFEGLETKSMAETLRCGLQENRILKNAPRRPELTGYIKDMAWSYEKEVRVKAHFNNEMGFERIAIKMPEYVIDSLVITPSPLFEGNIIERIKAEISRSIITDKSKFVDKLLIRSACDNCSIAKK